MNPINIDSRFSHIIEHWRPKIAARLNGQDIKLVKVQGVFPWHTHHDVDEMFLVWKGRFRVEFRDGITEMGPGDMVVVARGIKHRTAADDEAEILIFEPAGVRNTGDILDATFTAPQDIEI